MSQRVHHMLRLMALVFVLPLLAVSITGCEDAADPVEPVEPSPMEEQPVEPAPEP